MPALPRPSVLFVCVANSFRSQMAEAAARATVGDRWEIWSAGSSPSGRIHPAAIEAMAELKISLDGQRSKGLHDVPQREWDYVVTMGCGDACPHVRARHRLDWELLDPAGRGGADVVAIRDRIVHLVHELLAGHVAGS
jgi:protein-tyrosine-phosphatase